MNRFNSVHDTYSSELRELDELRFQRLEAKLERQIAELRAEFLDKSAGPGNNLCAELEKLKTDFLQCLFVSWAALMVIVISLL